LNFAAAAGSFTISGNPHSVLTIAGNAGVGIVNNSGSAQSVTTSINLGSSQSWDAGTTSGGSLAFSGGIDLQGNMLTVQGANTTTSGLIGSTTAGNGLTKSGPGMLTLSGVSANTFIGPVIVNDGILAANVAGVMGSVASITLNNGTLQLGGTDHSNRINNSAVF